MNSHGFKPLTLRGFVLVEAISGGGQVSSRGPGALGSACTCPACSPGRQVTWERHPSGFLLRPPHQMWGSSRTRAGRESGLLCTPHFFFLPPLPPFPLRKENTGFLTVVCVISLGACQPTCTGRFHTPGQYRRPAGRGTRGRGGERGAPSALRGVRLAHTLTPPSPSSRAFSFAAPAPFALCCHRVVIGRINLARAGSRQSPRSRLGVLYASESAWGGRFVLNRDPGNKASLNNLLFPRPVR